VKALPDQVKRRRPSLASVLTDDTSNPETQAQALAQKVHQAAVALVSDPGSQGGGEPGPGNSGAPQRGGRSSACSSACSSSSRLAAWAMPCMVLGSAVVFGILIGVQEGFTEGVLGARAGNAPEVGGAYTQHYDINEPIGAFIGMMAFIFALLYTSTYNDAQVRLSAIRNRCAWFYRDLRAKHYLPNFAPFEAIMTQMYFFRCDVASQSCPGGRWSPHSDAVSAYAGRGR
jgi:hypothetical protein